MFATRLLAFSLLLFGFVFAEELNLDDAGPEVLNPADALPNEDAAEQPQDAAADDDAAAAAAASDEGDERAADAVESNDEPPAAAPEAAESDDEPAAESPNDESESEVKPPPAPAAVVEEPAAESETAVDDDAQAVVVEPKEPQAQQEEEQQQQLGPGSLTLDISNSIPLPGSNVTVTCTLKGIGEGSLVQFKKAVIHDLKELAFEPISSLKVLEIPYRNIPRYSISTYTEGDDKIYALHITNVEYVDSGDYACFVVDGSEMYALKLMEVYQVPEEISFIGYNDSDVIDVDENDVIRPPLICRAAYLMPHADVTVTLGKRDVTGDFLLTADLNVNCRQNIGEYTKTCPLNCNLNQTAISRGFKPVYTDDEQTLVCRAKMRHHDMDVVETSLDLNVRYRPKIICKRQTWSVLLDAEQVNISCVVYSNPPISSYNRTWIVRRGLRDETYLNYPFISDDFMVVESMVGENPKITNTTLIINKVRLDLFRDYHLQATNELGTTDERLTLKQYLAPVGRANQLSPAVDVIGVVALFVTSFQLLRRHVTADLGH